MHKHKHPRSHAREEVIKIIYSQEISGITLDCDDKLANDTYEQIEKHKNEIDEIIKPHLKARSINELNIVVKAILRQATYEIKYTELDFKIAINEAINLTKKYADIKSSKFVNAVLNNIYHDNKD